MVRTFRMKLFLTIGGIAVLILSFQNCSKYQYSDVAGTGISNGLNTDDLPDNTVIQVDQTDTARPGDYVVPQVPPMDGGSPPKQNMPPTQGTPVVNRPPSDSTPPVVIEDNDDDECLEYGMGKKQGDKDKKDEDGESHDDKDGHKYGDDNDHSGKMAYINNKNYLSMKSESNNKNNPNKKKKCYVDVDEDNDEEDIENYCNKKNIDRSSHNPNNRDYNWDLEINGARGKLAITPDNVEQLKYIDDFRGKLILCGVTIDRISNCKGRVLLVDSNVKEVTGHKGGLDLIGESSSNVKDSQVEIKKVRKNKQ